MECTPTLENTAFELGYLSYQKWYENGQKRIKFDTKLGV